MYRSSDTSRRASLISGSKSGGQSVMVDANLARNWPWEKRFLLKLARKKMCHRDVARLLYYQGSLDQFFAGFLSF